MSDNAINQLIEGLCASIDKENKEKYKVHKEALKEVMGYAKKGDVESFHYLFAMEIRLIINGLLDESCVNNFIKDIFLYYEFIEANLSKLFVNYESLPCSSDKTAWVIQGIINYHINAKKLIFSKGQRCNYMVPKFIFNNHEQAEGFVKSLIDLYHGNNEAYLEQVVNINRRKNDYLIQIANEETSATGA